MDHARKMVIIPAERYESSNINKHTIIDHGFNTSSLNKNLDTPQPEKIELNSVQTVGDNLSRLDSEMYDILTSKKFNNDYEKSKNYLQVLRRYLILKENERKNFSLMSNENVELDENIADIEDSIIEKAIKKGTHSTPRVGINEEAILETVPNTYSNKAKLLLAYWQKTGKIGWDNVGVTNINGVAIPNSNIKDLLNYVLRKRRTVSPPVGVSELITFIFESKTPETLIGNEDIVAEIENNYENSNKSSSNLNNAANVSAEIKKRNWFSYS